MLKNLFIFIISISLIFFNFPVLSMGRYNHRTAIGVRTETKKIVRLYVVVDQIKSGYNLAPPSTIDIPQEHQPLTHEVNPETRKVTLKRSQRLILKNITTSFKFISKWLRISFSFYSDKKFRKTTTKRKIRKWIQTAEKDNRISRSEAKFLRSELSNTNVLEVLILYPVWSITKIVKPPFIGSAVNIALLYGLITTFNLYLLIPLFMDGFFRFILTVLFTGFKYKLLLILTLLPTLGFSIPIPIQLIKDSPYITKFLIRKFTGFKIGSPQKSIQIDKPHSNNAKPIKKNISRSVSTSS